MCLQCHSRFIGISWAQLVIGCVCRGEKSNSTLELIGHQVVPNAKQVNEHILTHQDTFHPKI